MAQVDVIRMELSKAAGMTAVLGHVDIKGVYLQSGPIHRKMYVRPPRELGATRGISWKLKKLPYGITEAGRKWEIVFEDWILRKVDMRPVRNVEKLFIKREASGTVTLLMEKVTEDLMMIGNRVL